jgi:hypothetical protein
MSEESKRSKSGRPSDLEGPGRAGRPVNVYLDEETKDRARQWGNGSISAGIRRALKQPPPAAAV